MVVLVNLAFSAGIFFEGRKEIGWSKIRDEKVYRGSICHFSIHSFLSIFSFSRVPHLHEKNIREKTQGNILSNCINQKIVTNFFSMSDEDKKAKIKVYKLNIHPSINVSAPNELNLLKNKIFLSTNKFTKNVVMLLKTRIMLFISISFLRKKVKRNF